MFRRRERSEELEDLLYDALRAGLEHAVLSAQQNDRDAQAFVSEYKEFYLNGKKPSKELSAKTGAYVRRALTIDATPLHDACYRWSAGLTAILGAGAGVLALTRNWWYALGAAAGAGVSYLCNRATRRVCVNDAGRVQSAVAFKPDVFEGFLKESKDYMGGVLWMYGALSEGQIRENAEPRKSRYRRSKV